MIMVCACALALGASSALLAQSTGGGVPPSGQNNSSGGSGSSSSNEGGSAQPSKKNERPAALASKRAEPFDGASVEKMAGQCVRLETDAGTIEMEMLPEAAPETVRNFLNLTAIGAFDTTTFSRVVKDFVVQGGNLATRTTLTPELAERARRKIQDEPSYVKHVRGIVSMARPEEANSATTHFFILVGDAAHLDGKFSAFARVTSGLEVADAINRAPTEGDKPLKPVRLTRAQVFACTKSASPSDNPAVGPSTNPQHNPTTKVSPSVGF